jgi:DNA-binding response OmpR family regulator
MLDLNKYQLKGRILIIDDDVDFAHLLRDMLLAENYEVDVAYDGVKGILFQNKNPYNLIVTDIVMPDMDGIEVILQVKKSAHDTKLIAISGGGYFQSQDYLFMAKQLGASMVFSKPFCAADFKKAISQLLNVEV